MNSFVIKKTYTRNVVAEEIIGLALQNNMILGVALLMFFYVFFSLKLMMLIVPIVEMIYEMILIFSIVVLGYMF